MPIPSAVDQAFFLLETPERPMNVGVLIVLAPMTGSRARFADRLVARMLECPVGPPFNYRVKPGPIRPLLALEQDDSIDARRQVHRHSLGRKAGLEKLFARVCALHTKLLPRDRPLWETHVFTGLPDGRVALYFKTHHGLIDGIGFLRIVTGIVAESAADPRPHAFWEGMSAAGGAEHGAMHPASTAGGLLQVADDVRRTASDLARLAWHQGLRALGLGHGLAPAFVTTPDVLRTAPSCNRVLAHCQVPLRTVKEIGARADAKVNDVMLAALDVAMSRYLDERGTPADRPLVADMPVALHDHGGTGNRITILQVPMGRPGAKPVERLGQIVKETRELKHEVRALSGGTLMLYSILGHSLASTAESLGLGGFPLLANLVISNPAGLAKRVYFNGAEVELALPVSVVGHQQVLNVTVTTYANTLNVTFIALREALPDLERLAGLTTEAIAGLARGVGRKTRPRRNRTRPAARRSAR
jgi:diacylglycerol O-acyltransferase / wax synthase